MIARSTTTKKKEVWGKLEKISFAGEQKNVCLFPELLEEDIVLLS